MINTTYFYTLQDIYLTIQILVLNLRSQNKLNFTVSKELENLKYEEKDEFIKFLNQKYADFKNIPPETIMDPAKSQPVNITPPKSTEETTPKDKITKEEVKTNTGENNMGKNEAEEVKETNINNTSAGDNKKDEKDTKGLVKPMNNSYLSWIIGAGVTGIIGVGLFFMFSRKKY